MGSKPIAARTRHSPGRAERFTGLELLFDLIFVFCVAQLTSIYREDPSWAIAGTAVLLFIPVWWAWVGISFAADRFPADDAIARVLVIGAAGATGVMGLAIPNVPGTGEVPFALGYAAVRLIVALYYLHVRSTAPDGGRLARFYAAGFSAVGAAWLASTLLPPALRLVVWGVATVFDVLMPRLAALRGRLLPVDRSHLAERCAAFVIIVIGEQIVDTITLASDHGLTDWPRRGLVAAAGLLGVALWWGFFERGSWQRRYAALEGTRSGQSAATVCAYLHFPLVVGITATAAGIQVGLGHAGKAVAMPAAAAITVGAIAYLLAMNAMTWVLRVPRADSLATTRLVLSAALVLVLVLGRSWPPALFVLVTAAVLVLHVVAGQRRGARDQRRQPVPYAGPEGPGDTYPALSHHSNRGGTMVETTDVTRAAQTLSTCAVLIVGAGPTGLTLAVELARRGVSCRLLEAAPGPQPGSRGKGVQPRTLEVFDDLGIVSRVLAHGELAMPIRSTGPDGRVTLGGAEPESLKDRPDIPYTTSLVTPQWRVEEALRLRLDELGGVVEFGSRLVSFTQSGRGVSAVIDTGTRTETVEAEWLVGCDGGHSTVRKQAGISFVGDTLEDVRMLVADLDVEGLDRDTWQMWRQRDGFVSLCPLPSTEVFQYQASIAPGQDPQLSLVNLQAILNQRTGRADLRLHEPEWSSLWRANIRLAGRYRHGRVLLAGDAAHVHSPAGGQGMNTGIGDAHNLGWKRAAVVRGAPDMLADSYEAERRPVAAHVLGLSNARLAQTVKEGITTRRDSSTLQLDVNYRGSALARDDRNDNSKLRAGDRAPDATGLRTQDGEHRLFDLTRGGRFTLLAFGDLPPIDHAGVDLQTLQVVDAARQPGQLADTHGHLRTGYGAKDHTLALIRPDGYLAVISDAGDINDIQTVLADVSPGARQVDAQPEPKEPLSTP